MQISNVKNKYFPGLVALLLLTLLTACGSEPEKQPVRLQGQIFGTFWIATFPDDWSEEQIKQLEAGIRQELEAVNDSMSTYKADSELNQLNAMPLGEWMSVSPALFEVLSLSQAVSRTSQGAFDVTVGGLVNLWSFGPEARPESQPEPELLQQRLAEAGYRHLQLNAETQQARRLKDSYIDLSGIAKGYAVDQVAQWLKEQGVENFLLNIGGDLIVRGERQPEQPWRIGVETPNDQYQTAHHILPARDIAMATSGDYRNFYMLEGRRMSHTINPVTGTPVEHLLASVTVLHPSTAIADAWATALMVMGPEAGLQLANQEGLDILMISRHQDEWQTTLSESMKQRLGAELTAKILQ